MPNLPNFILNAIENKNTSLGDNGAFHGNSCEMCNFLLNNRYKQVVESTEKNIGYIPTADEAKTRLSKLIRQAIELEKPIRSQLETLCEAIVNKTLGVPQETVLINCELVDEIKPYSQLRIVPEDTGLSFDSSGEKSEIYKRRFVDSMVQGISYLLMMATYDNEKLKDWAPDLPKLYEKIITLNDFLIFTEKEDITDENPMLGAYVETDLGKSDDKSVIDSQSILYPFLLQETYRGLFEIFGTHGLPNDRNLAKYIIKRCDFTKAEAWDLRLGVPIWQEIDKNIENGIEPSVYPYFFSTIVSLDCESFNTIINSMLNHTDKSIEWVKDAMNSIKHDREYNLFKADIERFNLEKCLVTDDDKENDNIL